MSKFLKVNYLLIAILFVSAFFRLFRGQEFFLYSHDQDLASWIIKDVVVNGHPRLIGQLTSTPGIFIGPYFYYYLIPFYLLFNMDPIAGVYAVALIGVFATWSFYFVFKDLYDKNIGLIAGFLHATSYFIMLNEREVVPTQPIVFLWSLWMYYCLNKIITGERVGYLVAGVLMGLIWSINFALVLTFPLLVVAFLMSKKKDFRGVLYGGLVTLVLSVPLIGFEFRHGFSQTRALFASVTTDQEDVFTGVEKFDRMLQLLTKNVANLYLGPLPRISFGLSFALALAGLVFLKVKGFINRNIFVILGLWVGIYILFFSVYSKILSEYYLNGVGIVWIFVLFGVAGFLATKTKKRYVGVAFIILLTSLNFYRFFTHPINASGYTQRKAIAEKIREDAEVHGYPCVSVSYITSPGSNLGYRYFYYLLGMKVLKPSTLAPVYSIVFPISMVDDVDMTFGALGLVLPDYERYTVEGVEESCAGENTNELEPPFGYVE